MSHPQRHLFSLLVPGVRALFSHRGRAYGLALTLALGIWALPGQRLSSAQLKNDARDKSDRPAAEQLRQKAGQRLLKQVADQYQPPDRSISDPEKYYWPKAMARLALYGPGDQKANEWIDEMAPRPAFHFTVVGMARMAHAYPQAPAWQRHRSRYLRGVLERRDHHNCFTGEGTENHIAMGRTSGYLFAEDALSIPELAPMAAPLHDQARRWILERSRMIVHSGTAEYHSSIYQVYNILGWLNLVDYAQDESVRAAARAVVDYYALEMALLYAHGGAAGGQMRGNGAGQTEYTAWRHWAWYWFEAATGEHPDPDWAHTRGNEHIQTVHAILSEYRPPAAICSLALEVPPATGYHYHGQKADYTLADPGHVQQYVARYPGFTLASAQARYGGWTGGSAQLVPWLLTLPNPQGPGHYPLEIGGNGGYYDLPYLRGRDPYTQTAQQGAVLFQVTSVPIDAQAIQDQIDGIMRQWGRQWRTDFVARFGARAAKEHKMVVKPTGHVVGRNASLLSLPEELIPEPAGSGYRLRTSTATIWFTPLGAGRHHKGSLRHYPDGASIPTRRLLVDSASPGLLCGWVIEVLPNQTTEAIAEDGFPRIERLTDSTVMYRSPNGQVLNMTYRRSGVYQEPIVDWGFGPKTPQTALASPPFRQPAWPCHRQGGRVASLEIVESDGRLGPPAPKLANQAVQAVYEGPGVTVAGGRIQVDKPGAPMYSLDYTGDRPVFANASMPTGK